MLSVITNIFKIPELRAKILFTVFMLLLFRMGTHVTIPGINSLVVSGITSDSTDGLLGMVDLFAGGALLKFSIFALGIMPYISASIVVQLMGIAIPYLQKLQSDGESGRKKINQITRWLTIGISLVQGPSYIYNLYNQLPKTAFLLGYNSIEFVFSSVIILTTGTIFAM